MRSAPDQRFLFLRGLRQILRIPSPDASMEPLSSVAATISDDPQRPPRRYDRPRTTAGSGIGLTQDQDEPPALPPALQGYGQALQSALQGSSSDLQRAVQDFISASFDSPQHSAAASRFILHHFFTRLPVLARVITPANLLSELQHGGSLLTQVIALRWDQTGENDRLHQLAQTCIDHTDHLTSSQAAEFTTALAAAIAFRKPALAHTLIEHAKPHLDEDADEQLIPDAEQCLDAGLVLEHLDPSTRETWCHRLRFADRNWNWETRESQRILDVLAEHLRPDARSAPLFEQIIPEAQWRTLFLKANPASRVEPEPTSAGKDEPTIDASSEPLFAPESEPAAPTQNEEKTSSPVLSETPIAETVPPPTESAPVEARDPTTIISKVEAPASISTEIAAADTSTEAPPTEPARPAPAIAEAIPETLPEAPATVPNESPSAVNVSQTPPEIVPVPEPPPSQVSAPTPEKSADKAEAIALSDKLTTSEPTAKAADKLVTSEAHTATAPAPEIATAKAVEAKSVEPRPRGRFLPFVTGMTCGLLAALGIWSTVPENQQTLLNLIQKTPLQSLLAQASIGQPTALAPAVAPKPAPIAAKPLTAATLPPASARARIATPALPKPEPKTETKPKPAPEPEFVGPPVIIASLIAGVEFVGPPFPVPTPRAEEPPPTIVSKPVIPTEFDRWKQGRIHQILREFPALEAWHSNAKSSSWKDASNIIAGRHPAAPAKSSAYRAFLTLLVIDPPKDRDVLRASHIAFARNLAAKDCLEVWEPLIAHQAPNSPEIRTAAGIMAELMTSQLSADTRQRLERIIATP